MIVTIDARLDYAIPEPTTILLQIEAAELADQRVLGARIDMGNPPQFVRVPAEEGIGERSWVRAEGRFACAYAARVEIDRPPVDLETFGQDPLHALPGEVVKYLMGSRFVPAEKFRQLVEGDFGGLTGGARVAAMRDWIEASLEYLAGASDAGTTAMDTFVSRQGVCRDYAHVLIALARAAEIPARMVSAYAPGVEPPDFHAVVEVWLGGAWRLVDPTGMARPEEIVRIGVGRDAADIAFMTVFGACEMTGQSVAVGRG